jgi:hypothetical protein
MLFPVLQKAPAVVALAPGQALLPPVRVLRGHDPFDRAQPVVESARRFVELVEKLFVARCQRRRLLPFRHIMENEPRQSDEDRDDRQRPDHVAKYVFHSLISPWP